MKFELICRTEEYNQEIKITIKAEEPKSGDGNVTAEAELSCSRLDGGKMSLGEMKGDGFGILDQFLNNFKAILPSQPDKFIANDEQ